MRVLRRDLLGRHEADRPQQLVHALLDLAPRHDAVDPQRPLEVVPIVLTGFSEPNGSWKIICTCER